jgi:hypothetical protein
MRKNQPKFVELLCRIHDLPLTLEYIKSFEKLIVECAANLTSYVIPAVPSFERYFDSDLPVVSSDLVRRFLLQIHYHAIYYEPKIFVFLLLFCKVILLNETLPGVPGILTFMDKNIEPLII